MAQAIAPHMNLTVVLDGAPFPLTLVELVSYAQDHGATQEALDEIQAMPDIEYKSIHEVNNHLGEIEELPNRGDMWASQEAPEVMNAPQSQTVFPDGVHHIVTEE